MNKQMNNQTSVSVYVNEQNNKHLATVSFLKPVNKIIPSPLVEFYRNNLT